MYPIRDIEKKITVSVLDKHFKGPVAKTLTTGKKKIPFATRVFSMVKMKPKMVTGVSEITSVFSSVFEGKHFIQ